MNQRIETLQSYNSTLEGEITESREQVAKLTSQLSEGQDVTVKNQNEKNKAEIQIVDL